MAEKDIINNEEVKEEVVVEEVVVEEVKPSNPIKELREVNKTLKANQKQMEKEINILKLEKIYGDKANDAYELSKLGWDEEKIKKTLMVKDNSTELNPSKEQEEIITKIENSSKENVEEPQNKGSGEDIDLDEYVKSLSKYE